MSLSADSIRQMPVASRRLLAFGIVFVVGVVAVVVWVTTGFGLSQKTGGLSAVSTGAGSVSNLIQEQTQKFTSDRSKLEADVNRALKSSALVMPKGLVDLNEKPDGVLYLTNEHREHGTLVSLKRIEFYPSAAIVIAAVKNEGAQDVIFDASIGSLVQQNLETGSELNFTPLFQSGAPVKLVPEQTQEVSVVFGPLNGRIAFDLVLGDFLSDLDPAKAEHWSAQFTVDPAKLVNSGATID